MCGQRIDQDLEPRGAGEHGRCVKRILFPDRLGCLPREGFVYVEATRDLLRLLRIRIHRSVKREKGRSQASDRFPKLDIKG